MKISKSSSTQVLIVAPVGPACSEAGQQLISVSSAAVFSAVPSKAEVLAPWAKATAALGVKG